MASEPAPDRPPDKALVAGPDFAPEGRKRACPRAATSPAITDKKGAKPPPLRAAGVQLP